MADNYSSIFKDALETGDLETLKKVPKTDFHNHAGLGMRFDTVKKILNAEIPPPPNKIDGILELNNYIFSHLMPHIKEYTQLKQLFEATVLEAIKDGVKILETSIDINYISFFPDYNECFDFITEIKNKYCGKIDIRPELGIAKEIDMQLLEKFFYLFIDSMIFDAIDLYGNESVDNFDRFKKYFQYAGRKGLKLKAHAGEFSGALNVKNAIEILNIDEIQHGIGAVSDKSVLQLIKDRHIRLNICPGSNIALGAVQDIKSHPITTIFEYGIDISINTDDLLIFNKTVSDEYLNLYRNNLLSSSELDEIRLRNLDTTGY